MMPQQPGDTNIPVYNPYVVQQPMYATPYQPQFSPPPYQPQVQMQQVPIYGYAPMNSQPTMIYNMPNQPIQSMSNVPIITPQPVIVSAPSIQSTQTTVVVQSTPQPQPKYQQNQGSYRNYRDDELCCLFGICICCMLSPSQYGRGSWLDRRGCCNPCCIPILMIILFGVFLGLCISSFEDAATYDVKSTCSVSNVASISCEYSKTKYSCDTNHDGRYEYCYTYTYGFEYQYTWTASCQSSNTKTTSGDCTLAQGNAAYSVGNSKTCYVDSSCSGISFNSPSDSITYGIIYLVIAIALGAIMVLSCWALYIIGSRGYGGYSPCWW